MADGWFVDAAPGETRRALVEGGRIVELHLIREQGHRVGEIVTGRIREKAAGGTIMLSDSGSEILMRGPTPGAGQACTVLITREAIAEPGLIKRAEGRVAEGAGEPVPQPAMASAGPEIAEAMDEILSFAQSGQSIAGGAILTFQRTKAGLVFDVDGIGAAEAINRDAAQEIARLLRLFQIGGMVMVDFIASDSKAARAAIGEAFDTAAAADPRPFERTAANGFGLMQIVRPRPRPSLLDTLFGTRIASLSEDSAALALIRQAARSEGFGARTITARPAVARLLEGALAEPLSQSARLCGAAVQVIADPAVPGYGHVHVAQS